MSATYTVFKIELDGTLSHKEHLDSLDEVNVWLERRRFNHVLVRRDQTGAERRGYLLNDGETFYKFQ